MTWAGAEVYVLGSAGPSEDSGLVVRRDEPSDEFIRLGLYTLLAAI